jgi:DNA polymerase-3 subunit epsilon
MQHQVRQLILDTETTGLDPLKGHRIVEFAALEMVDRKMTGKYLHLYINPERAIDPDAARVHGITDSDVANSPKFGEVVAEIVAFIQDAELIIHNAKFDLGFLDHQFKLHNHGVTHEYVVNVVDTLAIARKKFPGSKNNLDALCDRFKVDRSNRDYHGALVDCRLLADVYLALTREQISLLPTDEENEKLALSSFRFKRQDPNDSIIAGLKVLLANETETSEHNKYINNINKA